MIMFKDESDLLELIAAHDRLVVQCASGALGFDTFMQKYDTFPMRCALDGHESDEEERQLLARHATRCTPHLRIWNEILTRVCAEEHAQKPEYARAGWLGRAEATKILRTIARECLGWAGQPGE